MTRAKTSVVNMPLVCSCRHVEFLVRMRRGISEATWQCPHTHAPLPIIVLTWNIDLEGSFDDDVEA